jgi:hypothetical protein
VPATPATGASAVREKSRPSMARIVEEARQANVRNGVASSTSADASTVDIAAVEEASTVDVTQGREAERPRRGLCSGSLADVVLSASKSARSAASVDIADARTPQSLMSSLRGAKARQSRKAVAKAVAKAAAGIEYLPGFPAAAPAATGAEHLQVSAKQAARPKSRWGALADIVSAGGADELAAAEGGATFVHKARERFMDIDNGDLWELVRRCSCAVPCFARFAASTSRCCACC